MKALEPYTNKNNPDNHGFCNVCKKDKAISCIDCDRLDVSMCKLCHLKKFGTSDGTSIKVDQCDHGLLGWGRCILIKGHQGKHINYYKAEWDTRKFLVKIKEFLHIDWLKEVFK